MLVKLTSIVIFLNLAEVNKIEFSIIWILYSGYFLLDLLRNQELFNDNKVRIVTDENPVNELDTTALDIFVYGSFQFFFFIYLLFDAYIWINL